MYESLLMTLFDNIKLTVQFRGKLFIPKNIDFSKLTDNAPASL